MSVRASSKLNVHSIRDVTKVLPPGADDVSIPSDPTDGIEGAYDSGNSFHFYTELTNMEHYIMSCSILSYDSIQERTGINVIT